MSTYNDTEKPNVIIDEPHPGTFVIRGHNPNTIDTDEGRIVPLPECYVAPEVPTSALLFILEKRGVEPYKAMNLLRTEEEVAQIREKLEALPVATEPKIIDATAIESLVIETLAASAGKTLRIAKLAEASGASADDIRSVATLESCAYEVVAAGWVRLKEKEGAE